MKCTECNNPATVFTHVVWYIEDGDIVDDDWFAECDEHYHAPSSCESETLHTEEEFITHIIEEKL